MIDFFLITINTSPCSIENVHSKIPLLCGTPNHIVWRWARSIKSCFDDGTILGEDVDEVSEINAHPFVLFGVLENSGFLCLNPDVGIVHKNVTSRVVL